MRILHIVRDPQDRRPVDTARRQAGDHTVSVLLLQDAVFRSDTAGLAVYACREDVQLRGLSLADVSIVDYDGILDLLESHDHVVCW